MKQPRFYLLIISAFLLSAAGLMAASAQESFGVKEYDEFHHVLHPLQHEALPKNDFATIRAKAKDLIKLGDAIVKLGVPRDTKPERVDEFKQQLKKFAAAMVKFGADAESGSDGELKTSYSGVHESFEELAEMLPKKAAPAEKKN